MKVLTSKIVNGKKMFLIEEPIRKLERVIEDNQGQWKYPGQITKINSPNITMKNVPYPVLGISDKGDKQLMMPEQDYTFDGQSVTEYPITAQAGTTVKVNINNKIKEFDISSQEYKDLYNSGKLMSYDKNTDSYVAPDLPEVTITAEAPQWLKDKRQFEKEYTKDKFIDEAMPKFSRSMGISADNMHPNNIAEYDKRINDKVAESILKRIPKIGNSEKERLKWYNSFTDKEREIIMNSNSYNLFEPAKRAYDINESNKAKEYSLKETFTDTKKLAQTVQGTPERFRLFPNAENNIESYVNPGMFLGSMVKGLGNVPKDIKNENYGQAALSIAIPLGVGSLAGIGNPSTGQFVNNLVNPLAGIGDLVKGVYNKGALSLENIGNKIDDKLTNLFYGKKGVSKSMNVIDRVEIKNIDKLKKRYKDEFENKYGKNYSDKDLELYVKLKKVEKGKLNDIDYNINEMEDFIDRNKISREYTSKDKLLSDIYTKGYDSSLNRRVPEGITYNKDLYEDVIPQFEDLILKNKLKKEEVLYRGNDDYLIKDVWRNGERLENVKFSDLQKGDEYKPNSFYSTSIDKNVATRFGNIASKIEAPKGQSVFVPNATKSGNFPNELEVVLPEKLRYRVDEIYEPKKLYNSIEDVADGQELGDYIKKGELLYYKYNDKPVPDNLIKVVLDRLNFDIAKNNKIKYKQSIVNPYILAPIVVGALGKESFQKQEKGGTVKVLKEKIVNGKKQFLIDIKD